MYHSRYLEIADAGFSDWLADLLGTRCSALADCGFDPALVSTQVTFRAPAHYEDRPNVRASVERVGRSSFDVAIVITRADSEKPIADIHTTYVNFDAEGARSRPIPAEVADVLRTAAR